MNISPVPGISLFIHLLIVVCGTIGAAVNDLFKRTKGAFALIVVFSTVAAMIFSMTVIILISSASDISNLKIVEKFVHEHLTIPNSYAAYNNLDNSKEKVIIDALGRINGLDNSVIALNNHVK